MAQGELFHYAVPYLVPERQIFYRNLGCLHDFYILLQVSKFFSVNSHSAHVWSISSTAFAAC